ncbi:MAG: hypothetical protein WB709_07750 [Solirubrobacteraceae bacterium]
MKRISIVGLCLAAVCVFSAGVASSASADLKAQLKGGGSIVGTTFLSSATAPKLVTKAGKEINCTDATNHGKFLTPTLGDVLIRFLGCTAKEGLTVNCNSVGGGTGEIHLPLTTLFHLGLAQLGATTGIPALVILPAPFTIKCTTLVTIEIRGNVIGALQKENGEPIELGKPLSELNLNFQQISNGVQDLRLIVMPGGTTPTTYDLESSFNKGTFELSSEVANAKLDGFSNGEIEFVEP